MQLLRKLSSYSVLSRSVSQRIISFDRPLCSTGPIFNEETPPPTKPKKPPSAFGKFLMDYRSKLIAENPNLSSNGIMKLAGHIWARADMQFKGKYLEEHSKYREQYLEALAKYKASSKEKELSELSEREKRYALSKKMRELGKPKKPPAAYNLYLTSRKGTKLKDETTTMWFGRVAKDWHSLPLSEKEKYFAKQEELERIYENNLRKWMAEVMSQEDDEYKPIQKVIMKRIKKIVRDIDRTNRDSIVNDGLKKKRKESEVKQKSDIVLSFMKHFDK